MASNDKIILDQVLDQQRQSIASSLDPAKYFEVFTAEQILKDYDLSYDELEAGIVGGGGDGGIDSFYVFINGELLHEDSDFSELKKNITIEVFIIQAKTGMGFTETALEKFINVTDELFDLSKPLSSLGTVYNRPLLEAIERFRGVYQRLASRFPRLRLAYYYATKGDTAHPNVQRKASKLEAIVKRHFSAAQFDFSFLGARELLELARRLPTISYDLKLSENPISSSGAVAFVCLVSLRDFSSFITDSQGHLIRHIFEANVRDYQGKTQVNEEIQSSLQQRSAEDFWWLNNGITVLASKATQSGKTLTLENPEVVNGLQTSTEIYTYFTTCNTESESRNLLVRIVVPTQAESRDRIIRATNSQTAIPPASLRATDKIHRDIEEYLRPFGFYYDRRKNFYKNEGKPIAKIVSIPELAQAVMAIVLQRPDMARARPSSLIKRDEEYLKLFSQNNPIEVYRVCVDVIKHTSAYLNTLVGVSASDKTNLKFYVAMAAPQLTLKKCDPTIHDLASLTATGVEESAIAAAHDLADSLYAKLGRTDQVSKGPELLANIKLALCDKFGTSA